MALCSRLLLHGRPMSEFHVDREYRGLSTAEVKRAHALYGLNSIDLRLQSVVELVLQQLVHPFTVFQVVSVVIWSCEEYRLYAACILLMTGFSLMATVCETRRNSNRIRDMALHSQTVSVRRSGECMALFSAEASC